MEWYNGSWCVTIDELTRDDRTQDNQDEILAPILVRGNYDTMAKRGKIEVVRQGKGKGNYALIAFDSLPTAMQERLRLKYPDMSREMQRLTNPAFALFRKAYERDYKALAYYIGALQGLAQSLSEERLMQLANEYATNASVIQAVVKLRKDNELYRKVRGRRGVSWADMAEVIKFYQSEYGHTLGVSPTRFAQWVRKYEAEGYDALISKKFGNTNTLKVDLKTERLLMELASDRHRPYKQTVWEWYCAFLRGELEFASPVTGELYNPDDYPDLSEKTVKELMLKAGNVAALSKHHDSRHDYMTKIRPHSKRIKPKYSLSMLSMDDKDFGIKVRWIEHKTKLVRGKEKHYKEEHITALKAYLCFDVASEAIIGYAFSGKKRTDIFEACVKSMYRNLLSWGLGQPYEVQVENHLVSQYRDTMMRDAALFPKVTWAGAENSQEKYAERFIRNLKYQPEKQLSPVAIGRHYALNSANRTSRRKSNDEDNNRVKQEYYDYDEAVRLYERIVKAYNDAPHPKQKLYPGKSRLDVLKTCTHPEIQPINMRQLIRWVGKEVKTSINDRGLIRVAGEDYSATLAQREAIRGKDMSLIARYWEQWDEPQTGDELRSEELEARKAQEIHIYHEDIYIGACPRVVPFKASVLERGTEDMRLLGIQQARIRAFDAEVASRQPEGLIRLTQAESEEIALKPIKIVALPEEEDLLERWQEQEEDYASRAWADL